MSKLFRQTFQDSIPDRQTIKEFCRPKFKRNEDGSPIFKTEQSHKEQCDLNNIMKKYDKTGLITHVSKIEAKFGDMTGLDFKSMSDKIANARSMFEELPSKIRKRFNNSPEELLTFMDNSENREEAIQLGLINKNWEPQSDGLGEHVTQPQDPNLKKHVIDDIPQELEEPQ